MGVLEFLGFIWRDFVRGYVDSAEEMIIPRRQHSSLDGGVPDATRAELYV